MTKTDIKARLVGILLTCVIVTSVLSGAVSAEEGVGINDKDHDSLMRSMFDILSAPFAFLFTTEASFDVSDDSSKPSTLEPPEESSSDESATVDADEELNFNLSSKIDEVLEDGKLPFLFFYADWCGFSQQQMPILEELSVLYEDQIEFIRLNVDEYPEEAEAFEVTGYPTMFLIIGKNEVGYVYQSFDGYTEKEVLNECLEFVAKNGILPEDFGNYALAPEIDDALENGKPVFLFFYTDWCGFSQRQKPIIDELEQAYADNIAFIRVNAEENPQAAEEFKVSVFPTIFLVFGKDKEDFQYIEFVGYTEKEKLVKELNKAPGFGNFAVTTRKPFDETQKSKFELPENNRSTFKINITQRDLTKNEFIRVISDNSASLGLYNRAVEKGYTKVGHSQSISINNESELVEGTLVSEDGREIRLFKFSGNDTNLNLTLSQENLTADEFFDDISHNSESLELYQRALKRGYTNLSGAQKVLVNDGSEIVRGTFISEDGGVISLLKFSNQTSNSSYLMTINNSTVILEDIYGVTEELISLNFFITCNILSVYPYDEQDAINILVDLVIDLIYHIGMHITCEACLKTQHPSACQVCSALLIKLLMDLKIFNIIKVEDILHAIDKCGEHTCYYTSQKPKYCLGHLFHPLPDPYLLDGKCYYKDSIPNPEADMKIELGSNPSKNCCKFSEYEWLSECDYMYKCEDGTYYYPNPQCTRDGVVCEEENIPAIDYCKGRNFQKGMCYCGVPPIEVVKDMCEEGETPKGYFPTQYPGCLWCWSCGADFGEECSEDSDCAMGKCVPSCTGGARHCCNNYWSETYGCVYKCECNANPDCQICQVCSGGFCEPDDSAISDEFLNEGYVCCDGELYGPHGLPYPLDPLRACCEDTDCDTDTGEVCYKHYCTKTQGVCQYDECSPDYDCQACLGAEPHCCPSGTKWNGYKCVENCFYVPPSCFDTCNPNNRSLRWYDPQPYISEGYDNDGDGIKEASCPLNHNKVLEVNGDGIYDCCYLQEQCPDGTLCSAGICTIEPIETCAQAGYTCCDSCIAGTEHPEYTDCNPKVCCDECQFTGCNPYCPDPTGCDIIKSNIYSDCCNSNDPNCEYVVQQYTSAGWQMCGYYNSESCCAGWKEDNYCFGWQDDACGGGNCPLGLMHQTRECWGYAEGDCPESRCVERSQCEDLVIGESYAILKDYTYAPCTDEGTANSSCSHSNAFELEVTGEIGNHVAEGDMVLGIDGNTFYCEGTDNSAFQHWEPLGSGSVTNIIEMKHQEDYPSGCDDRFIYYGGCCYYYRCNSDNSDCGVTIKCPAMEMNKPALKEPLTREQYDDFGVYPHIVWFATSAGQDSLSCSQLRDEVKSYLLDPCEVTINGETYYSYDCLGSRCDFGDCMDERHGGYTLDYDPFFFYEEIAEITKPDLVPQSINTNGPVIETQDAFFEVEIKNKLDKFGSGVDVDTGFYVDVYVNDTFIGRDTQYGLQNGSSAKFYYVWENATLGLYELKAHVDSTNSIDEREEGNNWITKIVEVQPKTDIAVSDLIIESSTAKSGDIVLTTATVQNSGSSNTNLFVTTLSVDSEFQAYNITSLATGESKQITFNWTAILGEHNLTITADALPEPEGIIPETNELNNSVSQIVEIATRGNTSPVLSYTFDAGYFFDGVEPDIGNESTIFEYRVRYTDYDNDSLAFGYPKLWIDINGDGDYNDVIGGFAEGSFIMTEIDPADSMYTDGKLYWYQTTLPASENITYKFEAFDETGRNATGDTEVTSGPYVYAEAKSEESFFDTQASVHPYPSISGIHNGTITPSCNLPGSILYTYSCPGTGGHTEYVKIWNSTGWNVTATWNDYTSDWHNLTFNDSFTLYANETYNYTIVTDSYPQIIHEPSWNATGGKITCTSFVDINGNVHDNWIPAIRLE